MAHPSPSWGKANRSYLRHEDGRLTEEDAVVESDSPHVFTGKDETRATPTPRSRKKRRNKLPRPPRDGSGLPWLSEEERSKLFWITGPAKRDAVSRCCVIGSHDWALYRWSFMDEHLASAICQRCGESGHVEIKLPNT